uniref:Uncharacterized protein n=1 Tax=Fagus sylvatica TaxID=28930 RepID=A0A2N9JBL4_FAGSY
MHDTLLPIMKALVSLELLRHANMDVKVSVLSCITEITRLTAPDAPYDDEKMKEVFQLTIAEFENLSHVSSNCYTKVVSILDIVAKVKSCLMMLDLECDALVVEMFQTFSKIISANHPHDVFSSMETIMTMVIDESDNISLDLLSPLLASVRKENETVSPISWKLREKVITNCAVKLQPYLQEAVCSIGVVSDSICPTKVGQAMAGTFKSVEEFDFLPTDEKEDSSNVARTRLKGQSVNVGHWNGWDTAACVSAGCRARK